MAGVSLSSVIKGQSITSEQEAQIRLVLTKVELLRLGADDYVTKPFNLEELLARIERCLIRNQKTLPEMQIVSGENKPFFGAFPQADG